MQAMMVSHFTSCGGYYPVGGASEIAFNIIPVIEASGGKVLVRASVDEILCSDDGKANGVRVQQGSGQFYDIHAPIIVSNAGLYNTFRSLLPKSISQKSYYSKLATDLKPGYAAISVFVGLDKCGSELGLKSQNTWAFATAEGCLDLMVNQWLDTDSLEDAIMEKKVPMMFISFPSEKDPNWSKGHPERKGKSTVAILTLGRFEWFQRWVDNPVKRRGDEYEGWCLKYLN